ncbi:phytoene desaturase [Microbacterium amylolyticum]|uniref:Phytoene desaturase n=1 Tax=Microbacterium amylolyticum TaxID=936337 RepID=A0ABS4ZF81_9MICO|nr:phytoene desaturase family protein [Microbacterium amylolyticum]MBP2435872.1 phytoene desaturase [Microbacterium amylolyticum]
MSPGQRVVVIGGGISGLATAALLAKDGHDVTLVEAREQLGGRAGTWQHEGFTFDTGPSWYLMPEVFDHFFRMLGTTSEKELELVPLDPAYRVFFEGTDDAFDLPATGARDALVALDPDNAKGIDAYLASAETTYKLATEYFLYTTFRSFAPLLAADVVKGLPRLTRLLTEPLDRFIQRHTDDDRLRQVLGYPAVFLGTSPQAAPSMYHLMSHMDVGQGVFYPRGGFGEVISAIVRLAERQGVWIRTSTPARRIVVEGRKTVGVEVSTPSGESEFLPADVVVSTADLRVTERELLEPEQRDRNDAWWDKRDPGPGAVLAMLGVRGELPELAHHSLFFTKQWEEGFDAIYGDHPHIPDPASLYVCRPSATDSVAPPGHENLFVLVPVPADTEIGSGGMDGAGSTAVEAAVDRAIDQISSWAGIADLRERIVVRRSVGPADFSREFGAWRGGALGPAHTLRQSAMLRGRNTSSRVDGLLYAGATTIPGIGLPMCLISAELVVKQMRDDRSAGPLEEPQ